MAIEIKVSFGELVDKLTILQIKLQKIADLNKLDKIGSEFKILSKAAVKIKNKDKEFYEESFKKLLLINSELWEIEDEIRIKEKNLEFDDDFIKLARNVYIKNDIRFEIKNDINNHFSSELREQKDYEKY
tara:strand:+ start:1461 stop:1850 length:390 start_codon:yes stop_codon:yes gene_type:complete